MSPELVEDGLVDVATFVFPDGRGLLMILGGFYDESIIPQEVEPFAVAGFVFTPSKYKLFVERWQRMLSKSEISHLHATDLMSGHGEFKGRDVQEREAILRRAVDIILATMSLGAGARYSQAEFESVAPSNWPEKYGSHYSLLCNFAGQATRAGLQRRNTVQRVFYTFESGHKYEHEADAVMKVARTNQVTRDLLQYHGHTFLDKKTVFGLQAADLLAWSTAKEMVIGAQVAKREPIKVPPVLARQIIRLLSDKGRYYFMVPTTEQLRAFVEEIINKPDDTKVHVGPRKRTFR